MSRKNGRRIPRYLQEGSGKLGDVIHYESLFDKEFEEKTRKVKDIKPKTQNQHDYIRAVAENDFIICHGPAGTGKTALPVGLACAKLARGEINKIIITRPAVETGRGLGFLPGDLDNKIAPYLRPIKDEMEKYFDPYTIDEFMAREIIEIAPLEYMRGRNFHNAFCILDEAQNTTVKQIKMFISRMGQNSTCVINGDPAQTDINEKNGLVHCIERLEGDEDCGIIQLTTEDIIRKGNLGRIIGKLE